MLRLGALEAFLLPLRLVEWTRRLVHVYRAAGHTAGRSVCPMIAGSVMRDKGAARALRRHRLWPATKSGFAMVVVRRILQSVKRKLLLGFATTPAWFVCYATTTLVNPNCNFVHSPYNRAHLPWAGTMNLTPAVYAPE